MNNKNRLGLGILAAPIFLFTGVFLWFVFYLLTNAVTALALVLVAYAVMGLAIYLVNAD